MTQKQSVFGRMSQLLKANINALIDKAEDPQKMIDQLIRDYTNEIAEAEKAIAQTIGNVRLQEKDLETDRKAAVEWGSKALAASNKADVARATGNAAEADKWDNLAKVAIGKQISFEEQAKVMEPSIIAQNQTVEQLKTGLNEMKTRLSDLKVKRDQLVARHKTAQAQAQVADALGSINVMDPTSELARYEDKVRRTEAQVMGRQELATSSLESQFAELETDSSVLEVEARLAALKNKNV
ncbi:PspA/IM30 family protein [Actinomyces minihominis]|uniref:PspA/IM30 family protein n=1 Tax=Actinomyces minihominis TaxID=2002838 RepID=UPI000C06F652|nr:PspA/IM30 family protein [Actinomyces minihominis]